MATLELGSNPWLHPLSDQVRPGSQEPRQGLEMSPCGWRVCLGAGLTLDPVTVGWQSRRKPCRAQSRTPCSCPCCAMTLCDLGLLFPLQPAGGLPLMAAASEAVIFTLEPRPRAGTPILHLQPPVWSGLSSHRHHPRPLMTICSPES